MSKLSRVYVASIDTGVMTSAGDYPSGGSGVYLPANARVLRATLTETTTIAGLTNIKLVTGSTDLTGTLGLSDIDAHEPLTLTSYVGAGELKLTTTGTASGGSRANIHVEYVLE
tara:strand:- start:804 stop:1145 length:342 start_codon:yes stop_codon:yes gene_type:complete